MSATTAIDTSLVWLVNDEHASPAVDSRNLIRANAAAWGHKCRRHGNRNHARSKVTLAPEVHYNVLKPEFWHTSSRLIPSGYTKILQHRNFERSSPWSGELLRFDPGCSVFQREETAVICDTYTQISNHAGR